MSFHIPPQDNLDPTIVFDKGCVESRLKQLTQLIIQQLVNEDLQAWVLEHRKAFKNVPPYPLEDNQIQAKFYKEARAEAERILEVERKHAVKNREDHVRNTLNNVIRQLEFLVFTPQGTKGKIYTERKLVRDPRTHSFEERDVQYFETPEGEERVAQISRVGVLMSGFDDYFPYLPKELQDLYTKASNLGNLERVVVVKNAEKEAKTESQETPKADTTTA
jgi:hypothetical protein